MPDKDRSPLMRRGEEFGCLTELVDYQSGAVVSRTILKTESGNLTLFAFDEDEGLSEHTTPKDALIWILEGKLEATVGSETVPLGPGEFIRLPARIPHAIHALEQMKMILVLFQ